MKLHVLLIGLFLISIPSYAQLTGNSNIDGYYINADFNIWKIYTEKNVTYMEHYAVHARNTNRVFTVTSKILKDGILTLNMVGKPNPGNPNPVTNLICVIYQKDNSLYLDEEKPKTREVINGNVVWKRELQILNEFRKYDINYHEDLFKKMQNLSLFYRDSRYCKGEIFAIIPKYPTMEIASIKVDENFTVESVNVGTIHYEDGLLYAYISDEKISIENNFIKNGIDIDLFYSGGKQKTINFPKIGDTLIKIKQNYNKIVINRNDYDVSNIIEKYRDSTLIQFKEKFYILKDGIIIDTIPRSGETEDIKIVEQNEVRTIIDYYNNQRYDYTKQVNLEIVYN